MLYERFSEQRPPGWPCSSPGALCALAELGRAERLAGDVARLRIVAEEMRVVALEHDPARLGHARAAPAGGSPRRCAVGVPCRSPDASGDGRVSAPLPRPGPHSTRREMTRPGAFRTP